MIFLEDATFDLDLYITFLSSRTNPLYVNKKLFILGEFSREEEKETYFLMIKDRVIIELLKLET